MLGNKTLMHSVRLRNLPFFDQVQPAVVVRLRV